MAKKAQGGITIYDITDGTEPLFVTNSNPTHTLAADTDGAVAAAELNGFITNLKVYKGTTLLAPSSAASDSAQATNSFRISADSANTNGITVVGTGWPSNSTWIQTVDSTNNLISVQAPSSSLASDSDDSARIDIAIRVKDAAGNINEITVMSYFTKTIPGAGANFIYLDYDGDSFTADNDGTNVDGDDIEVFISTRGSPGARSYEVSTDGTNYTTVTTASASVGGIKGYKATTDGNEVNSGTISTTATSLIIASSNISTSSDKYRLKVSGAAGGSDETQIYKLRRGIPAEYAIQVVIETNNGRHFSSTETANKTLTARVYDLNTNTELAASDGITYAWYKDDSESERVKVNNLTQNLVQSTGVNATASTIVVGTEDVTNDQLYVCVVEQS